MGRPSKRATKVRTSSEFSSSSVTERIAPRDTTPLEAWDVAQIMSARSAQMRGEFRRAADMADAMRTDDALFVALSNRLAPQKSIAVEMRAAGATAQAARIAEEAGALYGRHGIGLSAATMLSVHTDLVNHGIAVAHLAREVRHDGARVDLLASHWPLRHVRWDALGRCLTTTAQDAVTGAYETGVEICHGDGEWVVFCAQETAPWRHGAIVPGAVVWARHAFASKDWNRGSATHGNAKVIGTLPEGMPHQDDEGQPTQQASAFQALLRAIASAEAPAGTKPFGSTIEYLVNTSRAWEVWKELVLSAEKAAARIYLGTDGVLGSQGGAPGVSIEDLFGVAETLVLGDLETLERGILTGILEPWTALNFGDSRLAPHRKYQTPRPEEDAAVEQTAKRETAFFDAIDRARGSGMAITQAWVDATAARYRVVAPTLTAPAVMRRVVARAASDDEPDRQG